MGQGVRSLPFLWVAPIRRQREQLACRGFALELADR